jgi:hypothetical protein
MKRACLLFALAACATDPEPIEYTGAKQRFVVNAIQVPMTNTQAREYGADLNGDKTVDNQLGMVFGTLASFGDITTHAPEMIASGSIESSVELVADNLSNDGTVALLYKGSEGDTPTLVGGTLSDGRFTTELPGAAAAWLPVFVDADPSVLPLVHLRATLVPDGFGGFDGTIAGAVPIETALSAAYDGIAQMIETRPGDHIAFFRMLDTQPADQKLTRDEVVNNPLIKSLLSPDLKIDGDLYVSIGFNVHLTPCANGRCGTEFPPATCFDRVKNGDETDVDCGGSCGACAEGFACSDASDCETGACNGTCAAGTCHDGLRDGFETDVDCGSGCGGCAVGKVCWSNSDCASGHCGLPCTGTLCGDFTLDTCR